MFRVVDGDTFKAEVDLGFGIKVTRTFRLYGVDTPETHRPKSEAERKLGKEATRFVRDLIDGRNVTLRTHKDRTGKYGRYLADVVFPEGTLSDILKKERLTKADVQPSLID